MATQFFDEWQTVTSLLPSGWRELADEFKLLQTQFGNAKITNADDLLRLLLVHAAADLPLRQTVAMVAESGGPDVSAVTLHKKMIRAGGYLHRLVQGVVHVPGNFSPEKWGGYDISVVDGTTICRPGSVSGDARIHTRMRLADLEFVEVFTAGIEVGESFFRYLPARNELLIGDRMYGTPGGIAHVVDAGADALVRVNRSSLPLRQGKQRVDLLPLLRTLSTQRVYERVVTLPVKTDDEPRLIPGRLIMQKLPADKAEVARRRLRQEVGPKMSQESWEAAGYVVLFTTVPQDRLSASECMKLYRLRWQIELQFKRWKSLCGFDRMPNFKAETILTWIYAKLLASVLLERLAAKSGEVSPPILGEWFDETQGTPALEADPVALAVLRLRALANNAFGRASQRRAYH